MTKTAHPGPSAAATLDIDALRAFLAVADRGGVTAAAERVARTPAAVSMQLKKLEEILGRSLFHRSSRGMTLTADGERLLDYARKMLGLHGDALAAFRRPALDGAARIGLVDDFGGARLSAVLADFSEAHPQAEVTVMLGTTERLAAELDADALDLVLLTPGKSTQWRPGDVLAHEEPLVWVGLAGGGAHAKDPVPLAVSSSGCAWRDMALGALARSERSYRVAYTSELYLGQLAAVTADLAVAPLPLSVLEPGLEILGPERGFPPIGRCRLALRWGAGERSPTVEALGERVLAAFDTVAAQAAE